jgi:succinate-semialdehyde dehydrogenase/glutarate-semialdehyde dehydrogenase
MKLSSTNPSKAYKVIGDIETSTQEDVRTKVKLAHDAEKDWQALGVGKRAELLQKVSSDFGNVRERLAKLIAEEMGMPIKEAREDVEFGLEYLNSYLETAEVLLKPEITHKTDTEMHTIFHEPYGVAACIVPWNFPFANFVWQCGQNLVAGNTVVFKHSEETPMVGKLIEEVVNEVLPKGVFNEIYGDGMVGEMLVSQDVDLICFMGSTGTGIKINELAAKRCIPTLMELGGSAPGIVFEDADISAVKDTIFAMRFMNNGQMCDALKRLIVHQSKFDEIVKRLTKIIESKKVGDACDENTDLGPLVAQRQLILLEEQVADAVAKGAKIITGGRRPQGLDGAYYEPTLLTNTAVNMKIWQEEAFGPVLPLMTFSTEAEAIELANDTKYGLGAYVFTADDERFMRVAKAIQSGMVSQNNLSYVRPYNPFGGYKMSGGSRQHARYGFSEVTQIKIISAEI